MTNGRHSGVKRGIGLLVLLLMISISILPAMAAPLTNNRHIFITPVNGVAYDLDGAKYGGPSGTYYIKADGGGLNELHITTDVNSPRGQVSSTSAQSGTFYVTNTGGRGFDNDIILLIAVREPVPDDFSVQIRSSGYSWTPAPSGPYTPPPPTDYVAVTNAVSETFTKSGFTYGPQNWRPGPGAMGDMSLPVYNGQDLSNTTDKYQLMFVDLKAGNLYPSKFPGVTLANDGAVKIEYSFSGLTTFAAFDAYGWCSAANQDQGISWTNPTRGFEANGGNQQSGQSGLTVIGSPSSPSGVSFTAGGPSGIVLPLGGSAPPVNPALYGYKGKTLSTFRSGTINGSVQFISDRGFTPILANNRVRDVNLSVDYPAGSNISFARLYLYVSGSHNLQSLKGQIPSFYSTLNSDHITPDQMYMDTDGDDHGQLAATYAYDVHDQIKRNGTFRFTIRNLDYEQSVFTVEGVLLVAAFENETALPTSYWIDEGCDVVKSQPEKGLFPDSCESRYPFPGLVNMSTAASSDLYLVSTGLDQSNTTEHTVSFNKEKWPDLLDDRNSSLLMKYPVMEFLNETANTAGIQSSIRSHDADYIVNRNAFLIVGQKDPDATAMVEDNSTYEWEEVVSTSNITETDPSTDEISSVPVFLDSDPEGALLYMDGTYLGKTTPYTLLAGNGESHTVRFELAGYYPAETSFVAANSTRIIQSLYTPDHSPKGRLTDVPEDPDGTLYGGLYIHSRPHGAIIYIDGTNTGKTAPSVIMGIEPGRHTIQLARDLSDSNVREKNEFVFNEQTVYVMPGSLGIVDISGIGAHPDYDLIIDSRQSRGLPFTVGGYMFNATIPAKVRTTSNSFITMRENGSYVSYLTPELVDDDTYLLIKPRDYQNLSIAVDSSPEGAEVFIDGFGTGYATPYTFGNISDGPHKIMVKKDGYFPDMIPVDLPRRTDPISTTRVKFELEEYPSGFLYVNSVPPGGKVSIDGLFTGEVTPALFRAVSTGTHTVKVEGANATKTFDATINSVEMTNLTADFTPKVDD